MEKNKDKKFSKLFKVGDNIQRALDMMGKTQVWLSEEMTKLAQKEGEKDANFDRAHINRWCKNRNVPSTKNMERLAEILGHSVEDLITGNFGKENGSKIPMDDPVIGSEIEGIVSAIESACEEGGLSQDKIDRYKALVKGKAQTIVQYIIG